MAEARRAVAALSARYYKDIDELFTDALKMKYRVLQTSQHKRESKLADHPKQRDHALAGKFVGFCECHVVPDRLRISTLSMLGGSS